MHVLDFDLACSCFSWYHTNAARDGCCVFLLVFSLFFGTAGLTRNRNGSTNKDTQQHIEQATTAVRVWLYSVRKPEAVAVCHTLVSVSTLVCIAFYVLHTIQYQHLYTSTVLPVPKGLDKLFR